MRSSSRILALFAALVSLWLLTSFAAADKDDAERIDKLIEQLGSSNFQEREAATKALDAIGTPALEKLRKAAQGDDVEVSRRAGDLVKRIEKRGETSRVLTPKRVHLVYKDAPLKDALEDFKKKSGYDIQLQELDNKLADRKVTLDTGDVTFWEAFDKFCEKAGLMQATAQDLMAPIMRQMEEQQRRMMEMQKAARPPAGLVPPAADKKEAVGEKKAEPAKPAEKKDAAAEKKAAPPVIPPPPPAVPPAAMQAMRMRFGGSAMMPQNQLVLIDRKRDQPPTCYAGAIRIQAPKSEIRATAEETLPSVDLQLAAEPKLQLRAIVATRVEKATDDNGQSLSQHLTDGDDLPRGIAAAPIARPVPPGIARYPMMGGPGQTEIQFKKGEKPSKMLTELKGTISIQVLDEPQPMMTVDNILKAAGTSTKAKTGGFIKVVEVAEPQEGQVKLQVELEFPPEVTPERSAGVTAVGVMAPAIRANPAVPAPVVPPPADKPKAAAPEKKEAPTKPDDGKVKEEAKPKPAAPAGVPPPGIGVAQAAIAPPGISAQTGAARYPGNVFNGLSLVDEKGKRFSITRVGANSQVLAGRIQTRYEITFEKAKDQDAPAKLVFSGSRNVTVDVPFTLKDVPIK